MSLSRQQISYKPMREFRGIATKTEAASQGSFREGRSHESQRPRTKSRPFITMTFCSLPPTSTASDFHAVPNEGDHYLDSRNDYPRHHDPRNGGWDGDWSDVDLGKDDRRHRSNLNRWRNNRGNR